MMEGTDAAELLLREGVQLTEALIKLLAGGSKNLAAFLFALARDGKKLKGQTNMKRLLKEGKELKIFHVPEADYDVVRKLAKQYSILFSAVKDKRPDNGVVDLITNADYAAQVNRIFERMGYAAPAETQEADTGKKAIPRAQPESLSPERGNGSTAAHRTTGTSSEQKPSVKGRLAALQAAADGIRSSGQNRQHTHTPPKTR